VVLLLLLMLLLLVLVAAASLESIQTARKAHMCPTAREIA
jgi:hypothetical protein